MNCDRLLKMDRSQATCHKFILLLLIVTLISTSAWCSSQVNSHDRASDLTKEEAITSFRAVQQVYTIILENYVPPVQPERLIHSVLTRLSGLMGNDQLSFEGKGKSFVLSSSGKAIQFDLNSDAKSGGKQMIRLLTFVAETNKDQGEQVLARNAIEAMLTIDAASSYFNQADYSEMTTEESRLGGIGLEITIKDGQITVLTPIEDSPALRAGILEGDRITVIDGRPTQGMNLAEVVKLLRGPKGSEIALTVVRDSLPEPRTFTIIRRIITIQNVKYTVIGKDQEYIRITQFRDKTAQHVSKAIE